MESQVRVVIVDDNEEFCRLLTEYFQSQPRLTVVGVAHEGAGAIQLIKETEADVLLLDMIMPHMDGLGVLELLHQTKLPRRPKIIVFTAFGQEDVARKAAAFGANYYIVKPFHLATLTQRILEIAGVLEPSSRHRPQMGGSGNVEGEVDRIMVKLGIPETLKGHLYLREAIQLTAEDPTLITEITKQLYPRIAEKYKTTGVRVERAMRFAIETVWSRGDLDFIHNLFGYAVDERKGKPTNASFIAKVADQIRLSLLTRKVNGRRKQGV